MIAKFEEINFQEINVWFGRYLSLKNIAHWHKETELIYIEKGTAKIGINKEIFAAKKGDIFLCKSGDIHYIEANLNSIIAVFIFETDIAKKILKNYNLISPKLKSRLLIQEFFYNTSYELKEKKQFYKEKIYSLINSFISDVFRNEKIEKANDKNSNPILLSYQKLIEYIDIYYSIITFQEASKILGYSSSHFSKIFSNLTGKSFTDYLNSVRIEKAIEMIINNKEKITNIAINCGFNSPRHFNRVFKNSTGFTPKEIIKNSNFNFFSINPQRVINKTFNPTLDNSQLID
jgi:xylan 1,4-beta-xylosidase